MRTSTTLFICPWAPNPHAGGGSRRVFQTLRALTQLGHEVHVLIVDITGATTRVPRETMALCASLGFAHPRPPLLQRMRMYAVKAAMRRMAVPRPLLTTRYDDVSAEDLARLHRLVPVAPGGLDRIHAVRIPTAPFALSFAAANPGARLTLDVDDIESILHARLAALEFSRNNPKEGRRMTAEGIRYREREDRWIPRFQRVYACSTLDVEGLGRRFPGVDFARLPNTYDPLPIPPAPAARRTDGRFRLLFVGSLGHLPNDDALRFFGAEVLPRLPPHVEVHVVGHGLTAAARAVLPPERVTAHGYVPDLTPHYAGANAVIAPIRGGGGTRVKIVEAFAHRRAVVSTTLGAEGLASRDGEEILLADDAATFAAACMRLVDDDALVHRLADNALSLFERRYVPSHLPELIA